MRVLTCLALWAMVAAPAGAGEFPYGSDGLPYFVARSELIIKTGECSVSERTPYVRVCKATVTKVIRGDEPIDKVARIVLPGIGAGSDDEGRRAKETQAFNNA